MRIVTIIAALCRPALYASLILISAAAPCVGQFIQWHPTGPGGGGAFYFPSISPHNSMRRFVASDMSGMYLSQTGGLSWTMLAHESLQGGRGGAVAFTGDPQICYAVHNGHDMRVPVKSSSSGLGWTPLAVDPTGGDAYGIWADPASTQRILVSDYSRIYFSTDGGATFSQKFSSNAGGAGCHVAGVFFQGNTIWIGTNAGLLVSVNGGQSFAIAAVGGIPNDQAIVSFAGGSSGGVTRFVAVTLGINDVYGGVTGAEYANFEDVYVLEAGQGAWVERNNGISGADYPFFAGMAWNDAQTMYLAGGSDANAPIVYRSSNAGQSWSPVFLSANNQNIATAWCGHGGDRGWSYPEYALGFAVAPNDASKLMFCDLGCVHSSASSGQSWTQSYVDQRDQNAAGAPTPTGRAYRSIGLENTACWWLAWADSTRLFAGFTDVRGSLSTDGGYSWSFNYTGHTENTMYCVRRHTGTGVLYGATSSVHDLYQSTYLQDSRIDNGTGRVLFSTNGGGAWQLLHDFQHPVVWLAFDPGSPTRMYASVVHSSAGGIFVSNNINLGAASTWTKLTAPPRTQGHPLSVHVLRDGSLLCSYSGRRAGSPLAFTNSSGVFMSTDNGLTWIDRSSPSMLYWTKDLVVDPADPSESTWYAGVFGGWGGPPNNLGGLYRTTNRGLAWTKVFDNNYVEGCAFPPASPGAMYVMTEQDGLWYSLNRNVLTPSFNLVGSFAFRHPLRMFFAPHDSSEMWVTTFGGGLWYSGAGKTPVELASFTAAREGEGVRLKWTTETETNCIAFEVQRRAAHSGTPAMGDWLTFASRPGHGSTGLAHTYECMDERPPASARVEYRLKQVDADGSVHYSHALSVMFTGANALRLASAEYSPGAAYVEIVIETPEAADVQLRITAMDGRTMAARDLRCTADAQIIRIPLSGIQSGIYLVSASSGTAVSATRLVVMK